MPMRFLIDTEPRLDEEIVLDAERSHYLGRVMRVRNGDRVACFDGRGTAFEAQLVRTSRSATLRIDTIEATVAPPPYATQLVLGVLKGQAMDRAVQQATELGATAITLLHAERSNVKLSADRSDTKLLHWRKIAAAACEQSGRLFLPSLTTATSMRAFLDTCTHPAVVLDASGQPLPAGVARSDRALLIGPEGGWSDAEMALFEGRGLPCYRLTETTLRAETVPAVALALFDHLSR